MWETVLANLRETVTRPSYETWLKNTKCIGIERETIFVEAPNSFIAEMLEQRMYSLISSSLRDIMDKDLEVEFVVLVSEESPNGTLQPMQ